MTIKKIIQLLTSVDFKEQQLTEEQKKRLNAFLILPVGKFGINAEISTLDDPQQGLITSIDLEATLPVDDQELHIGSYDIWVTEKNEDEIKMTIKKLLMLQMHSVMFYNALEKRKPAEVANKCHLTLVPDERKPEEIPDKPKDTSSKVHLTLVPDLDESKK